MSGLAPNHTHFGWHDQCWACETWRCEPCKADDHGDCRGEPCQCGCETEIVRDE